jgi:hypothetical protein
LNLCQFAVKGGHAREGLVIAVGMQSEQDFVDFAEKLTCACEQPTQERTIDPHRD